MDRLPVDDAAEEAEEGEEEEGELVGGTTTADDGAPGTSGAAAAQDGDDDEDDDDDDDVGARKLQGFIVDEEDEEEESGDDDDDDDEAAERRRKKRKKKRARQGPSRLDEEDYELIEEQTGVKIARPTKERRRIKKRRETTGDDAGVVDPELADSDLEDDEPEMPAAAAPVDEDDGRDQFDEFFDFIDDTGEAPRRAAAQEEEADLGPDVRTRRGADLADVDAEAIEEAEELFGGAFELDDLGLDDSDEDEDEDSDLDDSDLDDSDVDDEERARRRRDGTNKDLRKLERILEPSVMRKNFYTPQDEIIRTTDLPERLQARFSNFSSFYEDDPDCELTATWIVDTYFQLESPETLAKEILHMGVVEKESEDRSGIRRYMTLGRSSFNERELWLQQAQSSLRTSVQSVLQYMRHNKLEVPCVGDRYKDECGDLLAVSTSEKQQFDESGERRTFLRRWDILWLIFEADKKWALLQRSKRRTMGYLNKRLNFLMKLEEVPHDALSLLDDAIKMLKTLKTEQEVTDIRTYARTVCQAATGGRAFDDQVDAEGNTGRYKKARRADLFISSLGVFPKHVMMAFIESAGLSPKQLGENLTAGYLMHDPQNPEKDVASTAMDILRTRVKADTTENERNFFQNTGLGIFSELISVEPVIRSWVRQKVLGMATIDTRPTLLGLEVLDPFHEFGEVKSLKNKLVSRLTDNSQFAKIVEAQDKGLLDFKIEVSQGTEMYKTMVEELQEAFLSNQDSPEANAWNAFRKTALDNALSSLIKKLVKELEGKLIGDAKEYIRTQVSDGAWTMFSMAHYTRMQGGGSSHGLRVMGCAHGEGGEHGEPTTFAMLDVDGSRTEVLQCGFLTGARIQMRNRDLIMARKAEDMSRLENFIIKHRPHVIAVGASHLFCRSLIRDIEEVVSRAIERQPEILDVGSFDGIRVVYNEPNTPKIWSLTDFGRQEFPGESQQVITAIATGRCLIDPLAMTCALFLSGSIKSLKYAENDKLLTEDTILDTVEKVLVSIVNQTGVELNRAASTPWLFTKLPFVAGLGPRKAAALKSAIFRHGGCLTRLVDAYFGYTENGVVKMPQIIGKAVMDNAQASLRISKEWLEDHFPMEAEKWDPFDDTRIYGKRFPLAAELCRLALHRAGVPETGDGPVKLILSSYEARQQLSSIQSSDIIDSLDRYQEAASGLLFVRDIIDELQAPYTERRRPWRNPTPEKLFEYMSGESETSLRIGNFVHLKVKRLLERPPIELKDVLPDHRPVAHCEMDNGLMAIIPAERLSMEMDNVEDALMLYDMMRAKIKPGDAVMGRVESVDPANFFISVTSRSQDLRDTARWERKYCSDVDKDYVILTPQEKRQIMAGWRLGRPPPVITRKKRRFIDRPIDHIFFKNVSAEDAEKHLESSENGQFVFRPSSKGTDHLSLTVKFYETEFMHFDIVELDKAHDKRLGAHLRLGESLKLGDDVYEDIDEIIYSFAEPLAKFIQRMIAHRKFAKGIKDEIVAKLRAERESNHQIIAYAFAINFESPGNFTLSYIANSANETPHHLNIRVMKSGYSFQKKEFRDPEAISMYFKKNLVKIHNGYFENPTTQRDTINSAGVVNGTHGDGNMARPSSSARPSRFGPVPTQPTTSQYPNQQPMHSAPMNTMVHAGPSGTASYGMHESQRWAA